MFLRLHTEAKYRKVKNLYFERNNEIERLQNTLAHQRLAQSRISLDDSEYVSRFERLDGAIKNVAFEIRQNWKAVPPWLQSVTNYGAENRGGREMTTVGRASISRWVVDEILERYFHPALDPSLSIHLKAIEQNIRRNHHDPQSIEEDDALSTKVCNWRLTTLDSLRHELGSSVGQEYTGRLTQLLVQQLVASLQMYLHEPSPPGLLGGVSMIVDIAVKLASNLPLESRDVRVWYPVPGVPFDNKFMKAEGQLPPLTNPISEVLAREAAEAASADKALMDLDSLEDQVSGKDHSQQAPPNSSGGAGGPPPGGLKPSGSVSGQNPQSANTNNSNNNNNSNNQNQNNQNPNQPMNPGSAAIPGGSLNPSASVGKNDPPKKSLGVTGRLRQKLSESKGGNGASVPPPASVGSPQGGKPGSSQVSLSQPQQQQQPPAPPPPPQDSDVKIVRIAGFMAVEVRGRSILVKAPVWC